MILFGGVYYEIKIRDTYLYRGVWNHQLEGSSVIENDVRPLPSGEPLVLHFRLLSSWGYQALGLHVKIYKTWFNKQKWDSTSTFLPSCGLFTPVFWPQKKPGKTQGWVCKAQDSFCSRVEPLAGAFGRFVWPNKRRDYGIQPIQLRGLSTRNAVLFSHKQIWKLN